MHRSGFDLHERHQYDRLAANTSFENQSIRQPQGHLAALDNHLFRDYRRDPIGMK
jgi:hypothetical protein